jgi:hypothetical protein
MEQSRPEAAAARLRFFCNQRQNGAGHRKTERCDMANVVGNVYILKFNFRH